MFYNKCCKHIKEKYGALEFASDFKLLCDKLYLEICVHSFFHPDNNERNFKIFKEFTSEYKKNNSWEWDTTDEINILDRSILILAKNNKFRMVYILFVIRMYLMVIRKRMKV